MVGRVLFGKNNKFTFVGTDYDTGAYNAASYLFQKGAQNIQLLLDDPAWPTHEEKIVGFKKALNEKQIKSPDEHIITGLFNSKDVFHYVENAFRNGTLPDGLILVSDFVALGAIKAINKYRIPCPEQVQVVSFGNMPIATEVHPELSTVEQDFNMIGQILVQKMIDKMNGQKISTLKIKTKLIIRESTL